MGARKNRPDKFGTAAKRAEEAAQRAQNIADHRGSAARHVLRCSVDNCHFEPPYHFTEVLRDVAREGLIVVNAITGRYRVVPERLPDLDVIGRFVDDPPTA